MNFITLLFLAHAVQAMVLGPKVTPKAVKYMDNYSAETVDSAWPTRRRGDNVYHLNPTPRAYVFRRADDDFSATGDTQLNTLFVSSNTSLNSNTLSSTAQISSSIESANESTRSTAGSDAISSSVSISSSATSELMTSTSEASQSSDSSQPSPSSSLTPSTRPTVTQTSTEASFTTDPTPAATTEEAQVTAPPAPPTTTKSGKPTPVITPEGAITSTVGGTVYLGNQYTTVVLRPVSTRPGGLSPHNKRIVIGCAVGLGVPLLIAILFVVLYTCMRERRTDFINSEGEVITAYSTSRLSKWWNSLLGRKVIKYESDSPLGGTPLDEDGENVHPGALDNAQNRGYHNNRSHDLMLHEERYYDVDGNEINPKSY